MHGSASKGTSAHTRSLPRWAMPPHLRTPVGTGKQMDADWSGDGVGVDKARECWRFWLSRCGVVSAMLVHPTLIAPGKVGAGGGVGERTHAGISGEKDDGEEDGSAEEDGALSRRRVELQSLLYITDELWAQAVDHPTGTVTGEACWLRREMLKMCSTIQCLVSRLSTTSEAGLEDRDTNDVIDQAGHSRATEGDSGGPSVDGESSRGWLDAGEGSSMSCSGRGGRRADDSGEFEPSRDKMTVVEQEEAEGWWEMESAEMFVRYVLSFVYDPKPERLHETLFENVFERNLSDKNCA